MRPLLTFSFLLFLFTTHLFAQRFEPRGDRKNEVGLNLISYQTPTGPNAQVFFPAEFNLMNGFGYRRYFDKFALNISFQESHFDFLYGEDYLCWDCTEISYHYRNRIIRIGAERFFNAGRFQPFIALGLAGSENRSTGYLHGNTNPSLFPGYFHSTGIELGMDGGIGTRYYITPIVSAQIKTDLRYSWQSIRTGFPNAPYRNSRYTTLGINSMPGIHLSVNFAI